MPNVNINPDDVMIKLRGLKKIFGSQDVLLDVNLDIRRGETMVIIGQSGSGKSVILKHMIGLLQPDEGEVSVDGITISTPKYFDARTIRRKMGMLFQMGALFDSMDTGENIAFALEILDKSSKEIKDTTDYLLDLVGLRDRRNLFPYELSGGEQQRGAIARALANKPDVFIADEPTGNLDSKSAMQIIKIIKGLNDQGRTIIVVTHESYLDNITRRIIRLRDGQIEKDEINQHPIDISKEEFVK